MVGSKTLKAWMCGVCMRLLCVCVVLCFGRGLATDWSLVQGVLPSVENNYELNERPGPWTGWKSHWNRIWMNENTVLNVFLYTHRGAGVWPSSIILNYYVHISPLNIANEHFIVHILLLSLPTARHTLISSSFSCYLIVLSNLSSYLIVRIPIFCQCSSLLHHFALLIPISAVILLNMSWIWSLQICSFTPQCMGPKLSLCYIWSKFPVRRFS
jgi:hypothetical protein